MATAINIASVILALPLAIVVLALIAAASAYREQATEDEELYRATRLGPVRVARAAIARRAQSRPSQQRPSVPPH